MRYFTVAIGNAAGADAFDNQPYGCPMLRPDIALDIAGTSATTVWIDMFRAW
jgi:uncharacterized protein YfiM (DUF2279 family)